MLKTLETTVGVPLRTFYRVTTSPNATADLAADVAAQSVTAPDASVHFAVTEQPLSAAARASFTGNPFVGDSVHYPLFVNQYGLCESPPPHPALFAIRTFLTPAAVSTSCSPAAESVSVPVTLPALQKHRTQPPYHPLHSCKPVLSEL